jgi:hypothetical protein
MADGGQEPDAGLGLIALIEAAEQGLAGEPNERPAELATAIAALLTRIELATPGGAPLHAQLDSTRKWLAVLNAPAEHGRFGGAGHVRDYVVTQLRLTRGAVEDYLREMA